MPRFTVTGTYYVANSAEDGIAEVRGTCCALFPEGAVHLVGQVVALGEAGYALPKDLEVRDEGGAIVVRWVGGRPIIERSNK